MALKTLVHSTSFAQIETRLTRDSVRLLASPATWHSLELPVVADAALADRYPWLAYWNVLLVPTPEPGSARALLQAASEAFLRKGDHLGELLACAAIIETFHDEEEGLQPLDDWVARLETLLPGDDCWPSPEIEIQVMACGMAILLRQQTHPLLARWAARGETLMRQVPRGPQRLRLANFLVQHYIWHGNFAKSGAIVDAVKTSMTEGGLKPLEAIHWWQNVATHGRFVADHASGLAAVEAGLQVCRNLQGHSHEYALHAKGVALALSAHDAAAATRYLEAMRPYVETGTPGDQTHYWYLKTGFALLRGEHKEALEYARTTLMNSLEIGGAYRTAVHRASLAQVLLASGDAAAAKAEFERAFAMAEEIEADLLRFSCRLLRAACLYHLDDPAEAGADLAWAMKSGAHENYLSTSAWWLPDVMANLMARALALGLETDYAARLIRARGLVCPDETLEAWPWSLRCYGFGDLLVQHGREPLTFAGKAQHKPLELIKVLLANGGQPLPVGRVLELLWPDSEPEPARKAFDAALMRLRKLLGDNEAVMLDGGRLAFTAGKVWSDVLTLSQLAGRIPRLANASADELCRIAGRLQRLHAAPFLEHDDTPWAVEARERYRQRFVHAIERLGALLEARGLPTEAVRLYERGTDVDPLAETLYRRSMRIHAALGSPAEAMRVYRRCRDMLSILLSVKPSSETEALARALAARTAD